MNGAAIASALRVIAALIEKCGEVRELNLEPVPGVLVMLGEDGVAARQQTQSASSGAERARRYRASKRGGKRDARHAESVTRHVTRHVTERDGERDAVTPPPPHTPSPSSSLPLEITEQTPERTDDPRADASVTERDGRHADPKSGVTRIPSRVTPSVTVDYTDSDEATVVPLDLVQRAERLEVLAELSRALKQPIEVLRAGSEEFVAYWSIGGGAGRKKTRWMRLLREHLRRGAQEGRLKAPGLIEHEEQRAKERRKSEDDVMDRMRADLAFAKKLEAANGQR